MSAAAHAPQHDPSPVVFWLPDPERELRAVRLLQELERPRRGPAFAYSAADGAWRLAFPRHPVDRLEYQFEVERADGASAVICDPANPRRAAGPFGERSVLELEGYEAPAWVGRPAPPGESTAGLLPSRILRADLPLVLWRSAGTAPDEPLPLLIAHDGPEYDRYSGLTRSLAVAIADGRLPPLRAALLAPVDRNQLYSASAAYVRALRDEVLPALDALAPRPGRAPVLAGASLGGLAALHAHRNLPGAFGGLFLQSGSYFRERFDQHETGFVRFRRISRFVGRVLAARTWPDRVPVAMTCGLAEENLRNNRAVRDALARQGYDVQLREHPDAHNWISWRDVLDPALVDLLARTLG